MTGRSFSLIPFPAPDIPEIAITGTVACQSNVLTLQYALVGNIKTIFLPPPSENPARKAELWKTTCFEFFLAIQDQPQYWEFNLSPSGDWNVYHMDAYRRIGFREETSIQQIRLKGKEEAGTFTLDAEVDLTSIVRADQRLEVGVTAVIRTKDGRETYWALIHPAPQADFHRRESFILALAGQTHPSPQSAQES